MSGRRLALREGQGAITLHFVEWPALRTWKGRGASPSTRSRTVPHLGVATILALEKREGYDDVVYSNIV